MAADHRDLRHHRRGHRAGGVSGLRRPGDGRKFFDRREWEKIQESWGTYMYIQICMYVYIYIYTYIYIYMFIISNTCIVDFLIIASRNPF